MFLNNLTIYIFLDKLFITDDLEQTKQESHA